MFVLREKSRDEKTVVSNHAKEFPQMKKISRKEVKYNPVAYDRPSDFKAMSIQFVRTSNPFYTPQPQAGAPALTGHHIIPFSLLEHLYRLLDPEQKEVIARLAGADNDFRLEKPAIDYIGWPQKNIFYGPDTSLRAEPGGKNDFDYDARFIIDKDSFQSILDTYEILKQYKNKTRLTDEQKKIVYQTLGRFYYDTAAEWSEPEEEEDLTEMLESEEEFDPVSLVGDSRPTALQRPAEYSPDDWQELTTYADIELVAKYRESVKEYSRFRLPLGGEIKQGKSIPGYDEIKKGYGGYYIYTEAGEEPIDISKGKEEGAYLIIPLNFRGNAQKVSNYLIGKGAPMRTFLPCRLVSYIRALDELQTLRGTIKSIEESVQAEQEQVHEGLNWNSNYGDATQLQLDNEKLEEQAGKLSEECAAMIADCICIRDKFPSLADNVLEMKAKAEELKRTFDSET